MRINVENLDEKIRELKVFYEGMDEQKETENADPTENAVDLFAMPQSNVDKNKYVKQLLAFSDSRQQASFFAVFFQNNHNRTLRRRLVWKNLKDETMLPVRSLVSRVTNDIKAISILKSETSTKEAEAWIAVLSDLLYVDGQFSSDGIALFTYEYDLRDVISTIRNAETCPMRST